MSIRVYDLCGADENQRFSPACWRAKMALVHKGLSFDTIATPFTKIQEIEGGMAKTVPLMIDGDNKVGDSFDIAVYLDEEYPDKPSLFEGKSGIAVAKFVMSWANTTLHPLVAGLVVKDIHDILADTDQEYFRTSREAMFKVTLEEFQAGRDGKIVGFRKALTPLRGILRGQPFIAGDEPRYADYIVFGTVKWLVSVADFDVLAADDPIKVWYDAIDAKYSGL